MMAASGLGPYTILVLLLAHGDAIGDAAAFPLPGLERDLGADAKRRHRADSGDRDLRPHPPAQPPRANSPAAAAITSNARFIILLQPPASTPRAAELCNQSIYHMPGCPEFLR